MDLSLGESQQMLVATFAEMLARECPSTLVRDSEESGFAATLWKRYCDLGANIMGLPEASGGLAMGMLELGLVAMQSGRALAPVPFVEVVTAGRLLAQMAPGDPLLTAIAAGQAVLSLALPDRDSARGRGGMQMIPFGAVADAVVAIVGGDLVIVEAGDAHRSPRLRELGSGALARWDLAAAAKRRVLARGERATLAMARAAAEWKLLAGFSLAGIARRALEIGAEYARQRVQFGVPIGGFQAIAHPLAECAIRVDGAELLCFEAAWADGEDPVRFDMLASMAFAWAAQTATRTADVSLHTHGGYGFSTEYDIQIYFRRARAVASIGGGARDELQTVAELCFDRDGSGGCKTLLGGT